MIPGEYLIDDGEHALNPGRRTLTVLVKNTAERPIQVGSHYHFCETNAALDFDRAAARPCASSPASNARWSWWTTPVTAWSTAFAH